MTIRRLTVGFPNWLSFRIRLDDAARKASDEVIQLIHSKKNDFDQSERHFLEYLIGVKRNKEQE